LKWLKKHFPDGSKVLLVWDHAPAHDDKTVDAWLALNIDRLRVMCIPGGLTSIMQVCDLTANAQLKAEFKVLYAARWRAGSLRKQQEEYDEKLAEARDAGAAAAVAPPKPALKMDSGAIITMVDDRQLQQEGGPQAARGAVHPQDVHPRWTEPVVREHRRASTTCRTTPCTVCF
jgi:hypothetical protein